MLNSTQQENILCTVILTYTKVHTAFTNILTIGDEFCQHFNSEVSILSKGKKKKKEMTFHFSVILQLRCTLAFIKVRISQ